jgi:predicted TIM-barrel fold metal-dependent hydrolase
MESCPNIYFDISFFGVFRQLEDIVSRFGSSRLLFGTNMPFFEPGRSIALLNYSGISQSDREAVAYGNAERLVSNFRSIRKKGR